MRVMNVQSVNLQLSVWCVEAVLVSGCGVGDYSSVMRWIVVVVVCKT